MVKYELSDDIQRGIIYLAKSDKGFLVQSLSMVKPEYFEFPSHQKFYSVISGHYKRYKKLPHDDFVLEEIKKLKAANELFSDYKEELEKINEIDESALDDEEYLLDVVENFAKEQSMKEAIIASGEFVKSKRCSDIEGGRRGALSVNRNVDLGLYYFSTVEERWDRLEDSSVDAKYRTSFESLNQALEGGLAAKELAMVVAPPGVGKSLYLANQAVRSCLDGHNVLYISLEMSEDRVAQRLDSIFTRIKQVDLKTRKDKFQERLDTISDLATLGKLKIKEFPTKRASVNSVRSYLIQLSNYENFKPDVIIIDYLELMTTDSKLAEYQAQERLAQELRGLAIEHEAVVWTATQTNREGKKVNIISDTELADSYGKTRVCDLVFSVNQTEEEFDNGEARIYVIKSRNGRARFVIPASIDYQRLTIGQKK